MLDVGLFRLVESFCDGVFGDVADDLFYRTHGGVVGRDDLLGVVFDRRLEVGSRWCTIAASMRIYVHSEKLASAPRLCSLRHFMLLGLVDISWRAAGPIALMAPDWKLAVRFPMRGACARRRTAGLVGVWRSIAFTQSGYWGRARGRSYIEPIKYQRW